MRELMIDVEREFTEQEVSIENEPILMDVTGTLEITEDGHYDVRYFSDVDVDVVDGEIAITDDGTFDITHFETANINTGVEILRNEINSAYAEIIGEVNYE